MSEWISVTDRLPELDVPVLLWVKSYYQGKGGAEIAMRWAERNGEWWTMKAWKLRDGFTHWMPLPDPPEVKA